MSILLSVLWHECSMPKSCQECEWEREESLNMYLWYIGCVCVCLCVDCIWILCMSARVLSTLINRYISYNKSFIHFHHHNHTRKHGHGHTNTRTDTDIVIDTHSSVMLARCCLPVVIATATATATVNIATILFYYYYCYSRHCCFACCGCCCYVNLETVPI